MGKKNCTHTTLVAALSLGLLYGFLGGTVREVSLLRVKNKSG